MTAPSNVHQRTQPLLRMLLNLIGCSWGLADETGHEPAEPNAILGVLELSHMIEVDTNKVVIRRCHLEEVTAILVRIVKLSPSSSRYFARSLTGRVTVPR